MDTINWLLDSDPAIGWQVMRDLTDASPAAIAPERARVPRDLVHYRREVTTLADSSRFISHKRKLMFSAN